MKHVPCRSLFFVSRERRWSWWSCRLLCPRERWLRGWARPGFTQRPLHSSLLRDLVPLTWLPHPFMVVTVSVLPSPQQGYCEDQVRQPEEKCFVNCHVLYQREGSHYHKMYLARTLHILISLFLCTNWGTHIKECSERNTSAGENSRHYTGSG